MTAIDLIVCFFFLAGCAFVIWPATVYIFCKKSAEQRPLFVTLQMIFLNIFVIGFALYYSSLAVIIFGDDGEEFKE